MNVYSLRRASACLGLLILLGGCKSRPAPVAVAHRPSRPAPTATPRPTPRPLPAWRKRPHIVFGVQTKQRVLALTFDDGPDPTWTPKVLAILQETKTPATFFMVGKMVRAHPKYAQMVKAAKFPIGSHSWSHPKLPPSPRAEIEMTDAILQKNLKIKPTLFRPPYGLMTNGLVKIALSRGQDAILWNSLGADWNKTTTADAIEAKVLHGARAGGITLLHDGGGNRAQTVAALPRIIARLRARGFRFVTVPELLLMGPPLRTRVSTSPPKPRLKRSPRHPNRSRTATKIPRARVIPLPSPRASAASRSAATPTPKPVLERKPRRKPRVRPIPTPRPRATPRPNQTPRAH